MHFRFDVFFSRLKKRFENLFRMSFCRGKVAFFGLYSFASMTALFVFVDWTGCRGGLGGAAGNERVVVDFSDFVNETDDEERKRTVFKFEVLDKVNV